MESLQQVTKGGTRQDLEDALEAKTRAVEELSRELDEIRSAFGAEGMQQVSIFSTTLYSSASSSPPCSL